MSEAPSSYAIELDFHDDDKTVEFYQAEGLTELLRKILADAYYGMDVPDIQGIYRYDSPGKMTKMLLVPGERSVDRTDMIYQDYALCPVLADNIPKPADLTFTVVTDGRA